MSTLQLSEEAAHHPELSAGLLAQERELLQRAQVLLVSRSALRRLAKAESTSNRAPNQAVAVMVGVECLRANGLGAGLEQASRDQRFVVVERPSRRKQKALNDAAMLRLIWSQVFRCRVAASIEAAFGDGRLDQATLRARIDALGQAEFDEVRQLLRREERIDEQDDDVAAYREFAAMFMQLRYFSPELLLATFPSFDDSARVAAVLAQDFAPVELIERERPAALTIPLPKLPTASTSPTQWLVGAWLGAAPAAPVSESQYQRLFAEAQRARKQGRHVPAALAAQRAASFAERPASKVAETLARESLQQLGLLLNEAIASDGTPARSSLSWPALLQLVAERAVSQKRGSMSYEARVLYALQAAADASQEHLRRVDLAGWLRSLGRRTLLRELPWVRGLRVVQQLSMARDRMRYVRLPNAERKMLARLLDAAYQAAEEKLRVSLRGAMLVILDDVQMLPTSPPEVLGRSKLVEELVDEVVSQGFFSFSSLRDAVSRNQLKLDDLRRLEQLWQGDALMRADRRFGEEFEGLYRPAEIYIRALQKWSSVPFATRLGRVLTMYVLLPSGAAFFLLEAVHLLLTPLAKSFRLPAPPPPTPLSFVFVSLLVLSLIHSQAFRRFGKQCSDVLAWFLVAVFFRLPRAVLANSLVRTWLARPWSRFFARRLVLPVLPVVLAYLLLPANLQLWRYAIAGGVFVLFQLLLATRWFEWVGVVFFEQIAPTWRTLSRELFPNLLRMIAAAFSFGMALVQNLIFRCEEWLRFARGEHPLIAWTKGFIGVPVAVVTYLIRLYVTLLVEPEVNPLKHFPVVTVAHKLMLPVTPPLMIWFSGALAPLGSILANTLAAVTVFLLPSVFGFLAWELKENYRLYRATRRPLLTAAAVGPGRENMRSLLVPGFHSGALASAYQKLRDTAQVEAARIQQERDAQARTAGSSVSTVALARQRLKIRALEGSVQRFVERELVALLRASPRWPHNSLRVVAVGSSSNRIRVQLACPQLSEAPCVVCFEEQSGYIVADLRELGFVRELQEEGAILVFENALAGLYHRAQVDMVREQIESVLGAGDRYDIADEGLLVWPERSYRSELLYPIESKRQVVAQVRGEKPSEPPRVLDMRSLLFREQRVGWLRWQAVWVAAEHPEASIDRVVRGASLLPGPQS